MSVKIEMDMPKCCYTCPLSYLVHNLERDIIMCSFLGIGGYQAKRRKDCPLKEIK